MSAETILDYYANNELYRRKAEVSSIQSNRFVSTSLTAFTDAGTAICFVPQDRA